MISLRRCSFEDCDLLYHWSNEKVVRENAFSTSPIPYSDHVNWFRNSLESDSRSIFICMIDSKPVGMIRIDVENTEAIISYLVSQNYRGNGIGTQMLNLLQSIVVNEYKYIDKLIGLVKKENIASCKVFEKVGYEFSQEEEFNKYKLKLY